VNRPVRTRLPGGVGAGGEKPPATRLGGVSISEIWLYILQVIIKQNLFVL